MVISDNHVRTIIAVFGELLRKPYEEVNTYIGSETYKEMQDLYSRAKQNYKFVTGEDVED